MNNQQQLLDNIVKSNGQVQIAKLLKCKPQFISNIRRGVANLPLPMWRKLIKHNIVGGRQVGTALINDASLTIHRALR